MRKGKRFAKLFCMLTFVTVLTGMTVYAEADKLTISHMSQKGGDVYLYVNVTKADGTQAEEAITAEQLSVNVDSSIHLDVDEAPKTGTLGSGVSYVFCIDVSKSVTEQEMQDIRSSLTDFINTQMEDGDNVRILTIGTEVTVFCETTQDKKQLEEAVAQIDRIANDTYLYKGIDEAIDGLRKNYEGKPEQSSIIVFTDGMDDSDGAFSADTISKKFEDGRIPIYVVGLKGKDPNASLKEISDVARQSGGEVYSWNDMDVSDAMREVSSALKEGYRLRVTPPKEAFEKTDPGWKVTYSSGSYTLTSSVYKFSLDSRDVIFEEETQTEVQTETQTEVQTETQTEVQTETQIIEEKKDLIAGIKDTVKDFWMLFLGVAIVILSLIIMIVALIRDKRKRKHEISTCFYEADEGGKTADIEWTDPDKTINEETTTISEPDNEITVAAGHAGRQRVILTIAFDGKTSIIDRYFRDKLVLGRGSECDIDVVLGSKTDDRRLTSRIHATLINHPDGVYLRDEASRNKTYLNDKVVTGEVLVHDGDVIRLGEASVTINLP